MPETFAQFKEKVKMLVHPGGLARPLTYQFEQDCIESLKFVQRWVLHYKRRNRDVFPACATFFNCGATVIDKPRGEIQRLYTVGEGPCCQVMYDFESDFDTFWNWLKFNRKTWTEPPNTGMPALPAPFKYWEESLDKGSRFNYGRWTVKDFQIWIGQRIESTETIVVESRGIRRDWADSTLMPYDDADEGDANDKGSCLRNTVAAFVRAEDLRKNRRDIQGWQAELAVYRDMIAELKHEDRTDGQPKLVSSHMLGEMKYDQLSVLSGCSSPECETEEEEEA